MVVLLFMLVVLMVGFFASKEDTLSETRTIRSVLSACELDLPLLLEFLPVLLTESCDEELSCCFLLSVLPLALTVVALLAAAAAAAGEQLTTPLEREDTFSLPPAAAAAEEEEGGRGEQEAEELEEEEEEAEESWRF